MASTPLRRSAETEAKRRLEPSKRSDPVGAATKLVAALTVVAAFVERSTAVLNSVWFADQMRAETAKESLERLEDRLAAADRGARASWPAVIADLDSLTETEVEQDGKRFLMRSAPRPAASLALAALGVALPPTLRKIAGA